MRIVRTFTALVVVLVVAASVVSGAGTEFKGTTVTFRVDGTSVAGFTLTASAFCIAGSKSQNEMKLIVVPEQGKVDRNGQFTLAYDRDGTRIAVSGRVKDSAADGRFEVSYAKTFSSYDVLTHRSKFDVASCSAKSNWTAQRVDAAAKPSGKREAR